MRNGGRAAWHRFSLWRGNRLRIGVLGRLIEEIYELAGVLAEVAVEIVEPSGSQ